jgi:hypothetical protein
MWPTQLDPRSTVTLLLCCVVLVVATNDSSAPTSDVETSVDGNGHVRHVNLAGSALKHGHDDVKPSIDLTSELFELDQFLARIGGGKRRAEQLLSEIWLNKATLNTCIGCKLLVKHVRSAAFEGERAVHNFVASLCRVTRVDVVDGHEFCDGIAELFAGPIQQILVTSKLHEQQICAHLLHACAFKGQFKLQPLFWQITLPKERSSSSSSYSPRPPPKYNQTDYYGRYKSPAIPQTESDRFEGGRFLHLTDAHLDAMYREGALAHCGRVHCCTVRPDLSKVYEHQTPDALDASTAYFRRHVRTLASQTEVDVNRFDLDLEAEKPTLAGYWGSFGNCDLPIHTFRHLLRFVAQQKLKDIDYIVYSGDSVASNIWSITPNQVHSTQQTLVQMIKRYLIDPPTPPPYPPQPTHSAAPYPGRPSTSGQPMAYPPAFRPSHASAAGPPQPYPNNSYASGRPSGNYRAPASSAYVPKAGHSQSGPTPPQSAAYRPSANPWQSYGSESAANHRRPPRSAGYAAPATSYGNYGSANVASVKRFIPVIGNHDTVAVNL